MCVPTLNGAEVPVPILVHRQQLAVWSTGKGATMLVSIVTPSREIVTGAGFIDWDVPIFLITKPSKYVSVV